MTATATDGANTSAASDPFELTIDTSTPAAPTVVSIDVDTGAVDGVTSDTTPDITGTILAAAWATG